MILCTYYSKRSKTIQQWHAADQQLAGSGQAPEVTFWGDGKVLYLECGDSSANVYTYQNLSPRHFIWGVSLYLNYSSIKLFKQISLRHPSVDWQLALSSLSCAVDKLWVERAETLDSGPTYYLLPVKSISASEKKRKIISSFQLSGLLE